MALTNGELVSAVAAERAAGGVPDNVPSWKVRTTLVSAVNDCAMRLAKASGAFEYGRQSDSTVQFVSGALRAAVSAAGAPTSDDLARLVKAGIATGETSLTAAELVAAMNTERIYWNTAGSIPLSNATTPAETGVIPRTAVAVASFSHCTWLLRRPLLVCVNDCARRLDLAAGYPVFLVPNRGVETFCAAALRVAVLATASPTSADTGRLVQAGLA